MFTNALEIYFRSFFIAEARGIFLGRRNHSFIKNRSCRYAGPFLLYPLSGVPLLWGRENKFDKKGEYRLPGEQDKEKI